MLGRNRPNFTGGEDPFPFELGYLPEPFFRKAEKELHETAERKSQGIRQIREASERDKIMRTAEFDDDFLLQYFRGRKYDVSKAFSSLKAAVYLRKTNVDMFKDYRFEVSVKAIKDKIFTILPWRCPEGCAILLIQLGNWIPENFPIEEVRRTLVIMLTQCLLEPMTQVNGIKVIFDARSNPLLHLRHCTPHNIYLIYHGTQNCIPLRFKEVHIVNLSLTFKTAWIFLKHFLSEKLKKRFHMHPTEHKLLDFFPRSVLPVEYGGDLEDYDMSEWLRKVMSPEKLANIMDRSLSAKSDFE